MLQLWAISSGTLSSHLSWYSQILCMINLETSTTGAKIPIGSNRLKARLKTLLFVGLSPITPACSRSFLGWNTKWSVSGSQNTPNALLLSVCDTRNSNKFYTTTKKQEILPPFTAQFYFKKLVDSHILNIKSTLKKRLPALKMTPHRRRNHAQNKNGHRNCILHLPAIWRHPKASLWE